MDITLIKQSKHCKKITDWSGGWDNSNYSYANEYTKPSEVLRSYYQFCEAYEPIGWIATNMTADQFDELYNQGQRIFQLEDNHEWMIVRLDEESVDYLKKEKEEQKAKNNDELLDNLLCDCHNYVGNYLNSPNKEEFTKMVKNHEDFFNDKISKEVYEDIYMEIERSVDKRYEANCF